MAQIAPNPVVHLELHTGDAARARSLYAEVCGWLPEMVEVCGTHYLALDFGRGLGGGIVECPAASPRWLPYVEVPDIRAATDQARRSGAAVLLDVSEGPAGWRSVVASPAAGEIAFWQLKKT